MRKIFLGLVLLVFIFTQNLYSQDKEISFSDNSKYFGSLKNGISNGFGTFTTSNQVCVGEWNGHRNGKNITCTWAADSKWKGDKYVGELKNGKRDGKGTYYYFSSGEKYIGEWKDGERNGKGITSFSNGNEYMGEWKNGKKNGEGTNKFSDRKLIKEIWSDGTLVRSKEISVDNKDKEKLDLQIENKKLIAEKQKEIQETRLAEENKKKQLIAEKQKKLQETKLAEENKKKQLIAEKQKTEEERANRLLASMKPEERRSYICEKTYGFRKGSDKFGDCVFKIMAADLEIEKLEMQKKITEAQIEANKKSSTSYDPSVGRAAERAVDIEAARFKREQELETARLAFALSKGLGTPGGINSKIQGTADALNPNQRQAPVQNNNPFPKQTYCKLNPINNRISCYTQ